MTRTTDSSIVGRVAPTLFAFVPAILLPGCATAPAERPPEMAPAARTEKPPVSADESGPVPRANDVNVCVFEGGDAQFLRRDELGIGTGWVVDPRPWSENWYDHQFRHLDQGIGPDLFGPPAK